MRAIVTGGCGFAGAAVTRALVDRGDQVLCIDRKGKSKRVPQLAAIEGREGFVRLEADASDKRLMRALFHEFKPECVFHLTAPIGEDAEDYYSAGPDAGFSVLEASIAHLARLPAANQDRFRFIHSLHLLQAPEDAGATPRETMALAGANLISDWARARGLNAILCVAPDLIGPYVPETSMMGQTLGALMTGKTVTLPAGGDTVRDWLPMRDYVLGLVLAAARGEPDTVYGFSVEAVRRDEDMFTAIADRLDMLRPRVGGARRSLLKAEPGDPFFGSPPAIDSSRAESDLGWRPQGFHAGVERMLAWALKAYPEVGAGLARAAE
jgi:nucleoside-diphosphate-sugar epimerase